MHIDNSRIILTGAASGIGLAVLNELAHYDTRLIAVDLDLDRMSEAIRTLNHPRATIIPYACDVSSPQNIDRLFEDAIQQMGGIDLFIANAGFAYYEQIGAADWDRLERIYRVNVFAPMYAAFKMKELNNTRPYKVVMTASAMGKLAIPGYAIYSSTKAALDRFAEGYRFELADPRNLMLVYPIGTRTQFFNAAGQRIPVPWPTQTPEQVARAMVHGIERDQRSMYPSTLFRLILLLDRLLPFTRRIEQRLELRKFKKWQSQA